MVKHLQSLLLTTFLGLVSTTVAFGQSVRGKVTDAEGLPLPGASVVVAQQEGVGTATDGQGNYRITGLEPGRYTLRFSFMGYQASNRKVNLEQGESKELNVQLKEDQSQLDEVVIVGYGVQRKRDMTANIAQLEGKEVRDMPAPSFEAAMQGKIAGVQISTSGGMAGSGSVVRVRGIASIGAGGDPLYIVDGVQLNQDYFAGRSFGRASSGGMNQNPLAFLNPDDIKSVKVLKDAAATAIYGSRGSNGVVLITTKRGSTKKPTFNFTTTQAISQPVARPRMLNADQWLGLYEEAWINDGNTGTPTGLPAQMTWEEAQQHNTNWLDRTLRTGHKQFYDFSVSQRLKDFNYYGGISYDANQSYLQGDEYQRLSGRFNADWDITEELKLSASTNATRAVYERVGNAWAGGLGSAMSTALPIYPVRYEKNVYEPDPDNPGDSVLAHQEGDYWMEAGANNNPEALRELKRWRNTELRFVNNLELQFTPTEDLSFKVSGSWDHSSFREDVYEPADLPFIGNNEVLGQGLAKRYPRVSNSYNFHATGSYNWQPAEDHSFTFMLGTEYVSRRSEVFRNVRYDADSNIIVNNEVFDAEGPFFENEQMRDSVQFDSVQLESQIRFASLFGRVNYGFKDRYLAQLVLRTDGSSAFGPNNRYGFFPSLGLGWIMSDESWLKYNPVINYLKLRGSIGLVGNANIGQNEFLARYQVNGTGYNDQPIRFPINAPNPGLKWETTEVIDATVEFGLWEDRITGEVAYYRKNTRDVLMNVALPRINGFNSFTDNVGGILNYGWEFNLTTNNLTGDFWWKTNFNVALNRNRITSLGGYSEDAVAGGTNDTRVVEGESVGTFYMVPVDHIDPATGDPVYLSASGELTKVYDQANRRPVGKGIPDAIGGITNTFGYKNWRFSALFVYSIGADVYNHSGKYQQTAWPAFGNYWNYTEQVYDRWQQPGDQARLPRLTLDPRNYEGLGEDFWNTDRWVQDASYLRLRNLTVSYQVDREIAQNWGLQDLSISLIGTNLFTITDYPGLDPEVARDFTNVTDRNMSLNTTYLTPPQERTFSIKIDASF